MSDYHTAYYAGYNIRFNVITNAAVDVGFCCEAMKMEEGKKREDSGRRGKGRKEKEGQRGEGRARICRCRASINRLIHWQALFVVFAHSFLAKSYNSNGRCNKKRWHHRCKIIMLKDSGVKTLRIYRYAWSRNCKIAINKIADQTNHDPTLVNSIIAIIY